MFQLPTSFDPHLLEDQLLTVLKASTITQHLVPLRAQQIIQTIIQKPIIQSLKHQISVIKYKYDQERNSKRFLRSDGKRMNAEFEQQQNKNDEQILQLKSQIERFQQKTQTLTQEFQLQQQELQKCYNNLSLLESENQNNKKIIQEQRIDIETMKREKQMMLKQHNRHKQEMRQSNQELKEKIKVLEQKTKQNQIKKIEVEKDHLVYSMQQAEMKTAEKSKKEEQIRNKSKTIQALKQQKLILKNQINGLKIDIADLKQQLLSYQQNYTKANNQNSKLKDTIKQNKTSFDREKKLINAKLVELTHSYKAYQKLKSSLKTVIKFVNQVREEHRRLGGWIGDQLRKLSVETHNTTNQILDTLGEKVGRDVQNLTQKLRLQISQSSAAKSQQKLKGEALERYENMVAINTMENNQLKNQIRLRRRQEERLRRQLKKSYQENQIKFNLLQKKYYDLLKGLPY